MTVHYYFVPMETIGMSRAPKYIKHFDNPTGVDCNFSILDYGLIDVAALAADVNSDTASVFIRPD